MYPAGIFTCCEYSRNRSGATQINLNAAHHIVGSRSDFNRFRNEVETNIRTPFDHTLELFANRVCVKVIHTDEHPSIWPCRTGPHLFKHGSADNIAGGTFSSRIVIQHESLAVAVQQIASGTSQSFFNDGAGDSGSSACKQSGGVKLDHFHVSQLESKSKCQGQTVAGFVGRWCVKLVHGGPGSGCDYNCLGLNEPKLSAANVNHQHRGDSALIFIRDQFDCPMFFQQLNRSDTYLFRQPIHDFNSGQVALVYSAIKSLTCECFLVNGSVTVSIKEASMTVFQLQDPFRCHGNKRPGKFLVVDPLASFNRVSKMCFNGISFAQGNVVSALNHACTA